MVVERRSAQEAGVQWSRRTAVAHLREAALSEQHGSQPNEQQEPQKRSRRGRRQPINDAAPRAAEDVGEDPSSQLAQRARAPSSRRRRAAVSATRARRRIAASVVGDDLPSRPSVDGKSYGAELANAYKRCGEITKIFSKTFYFGTTFFSQEKAGGVGHLRVVPATDDIVDSPLAAMLGPERMEEDLRLWKERLDRIWVQEPTDALDMALSDAKKNYPSMDIEPYNDMIDGMLMDTPGHQLFQDRYETWDELYTYCYRVAGTVGLMVLPVLGYFYHTHAGGGHTTRTQLGDSLPDHEHPQRCGRRRAYEEGYTLPREDMAKFGVTEEQIIKGVLDENYKDLMKFEIQRARDYYVEAEAGIPMLAPEARVGVAMALRVYRGILDKLEENDYDNFRKRAYVSKLEKFLYLPDAWKATSGLPP